MTLPSGFQRALLLPERYNATAEERSADEQNGFVLCCVRTAATQLDARCGEISLITELAGAFACQRRDPNDFVTASESEGSRRRQMCSS